jgi:hypothetical protein
VNGGVGALVLDDQTCEEDLEGRDRVRHRGTTAHHIVSSKVDSTGYG